MVDSGIRTGFRDYIFLGCSGSHPDLAAACATAAGAQTPEKNAAVYLCAGPDREQPARPSGAQEGALVVYTSLATSDRFRSPRPSKKNTREGRAMALALRPGREARPERGEGAPPRCRRGETNAPELEALARGARHGAIRPALCRRIPAWGVPAHGMWVSDRVDFFVVAFNTAKVRREDLPATYEGFLDPNGRAASGWKRPIRSGSPGWRSTGREARARVLPPARGDEPRRAQGHVLCRRWSSRARCP